MMSPGLTSNDFNFEWPVRRSYDDEVAFGITEADVTGGLCFLNYMSGNEAKYDCIRRSACEDPKTGSDYLNAAKMWYKMHALIK